MTSLQRLIARIADLDESGTAPRAARARLSPTESQAVFRTLLDSLARPGLIHQLPVEIVARVPPVIVPMLALADVETTIALTGEEADEPAEWTDAIVTATGARVASLDDAQWVASLGDASSATVSPAMISTVRTGTALAPEDGARLSIRVEGFAAAGLTLRGPGVAGSVEIGLRGVGIDVIDALRVANSAYPAGIDVWCITDSGAVVGLPRSVRIETTGASASQDERHNG